MVSWHHIYKSEQFTLLTHFNILTSQCFFWLKTLWERSWLHSIAAHWQYCIAAHWQYCIKLFCSWCPIILYLQYTLVILIISADAIFTLLLVSWSLYNLRMMLLSMVQSHLELAMSVYCSMVYSLCYHRTDLRFDSILLKYLQSNGSLGCLGTIPCWLWPFLYHLYQLILEE
jgi:hypothetical protein